MPVILKPSAGGGGGGGVTNPLSEDLDAGGYRITNLGEPVDDSDAVTKSYVTSLIGALSFTETVFLASTETLIGVYDNGVSGGVGATFTLTAPGALEMDGETPSVTQRLLLKDQADPIQNGIFTLTVAGDIGTSAVLTRSLDFDTPEEIQPGDIVPVQAGTMNSGTFWLQTAVVDSIGTDPISFSQFGAAGTVFGPSPSTNRALASYNGTMGNLLFDNPDTNLDEDGNLFANSQAQRLQLIVSAGGTTVFTAASPQFTGLTGTLDETFQMADATTLRVGRIFQFLNLSTGLLTIMNALGGILATFASGGGGRFIVADNSGSSGSWATEVTLQGNFSADSSGLIVPTRMGVYDPNSTFNVGFKAPALVANIDFTWPGALGAANSAMVDLAGDGIFAMRVVAQLALAQTWGADQNWADFLLQRPYLQDYAEVVATVAAATTTNIDIQNGNVVNMSQNTNVTTLNFNNPAATGRCCSFTLIRTKDNSGTTRTIAWPASVVWAGGVAPTLTQTANAVDIFQFFTVNGGTSWNGFVSGQAMA